MFKTSVPCSFSQVLGSPSAVFDDVKRNEKLKKHKRGFGVIYSMFICIRE